MLDSDFRIERPKRYYRQGLSFLHPDMIAHHEHDTHPNDYDGDQKSIMGSIKGKLSKALNFRRSEDSRPNPEGMPHIPRASSVPGSSSSSISSRAPTPLLDPSTNANPLSGPNEHHDVSEDGEKWENKKKGRTDREVSKHTFYISNSQMRLKLIARNEVCPFVFILFGKLY